MGGTNRYRIRNAAWTTEYRSTLTSARLRGEWLSAKLLEPSTVQERSADGSWVTINP
jgi:hypothetical protein